MPLSTLRLLSLRTTEQLNPLQSFLTELKRSNLKPIVVSRVVRWIILPKDLSTSELLARNVHWDLLIILPSQDALPSQLQRLIAHEWSTTAGIPSRLLQDFNKKNAELLHPDPAKVAKLTSAKDKKENAQIAESSQNLELSPELQSWISDFTSSTSTNVEGRGAVSMLNLLSFKPNMKPSYLKYGQAFASSVGIRHGGIAKIVGTVVDVNGTEKKEGDGGWDEVALAHYPTIKHFAQMLGSADYQEVNKKYRVPALKDTLILCTSEVGIEEMMGNDVQKSML